jgi:acyl-CoA dehydrogenase
VDFAPSELSQRMAEQLQEFMDTQVVPRAAQFEATARDGRYPLELLEELKSRARAEGLWNLFLPSLTDDEPGTRLSNLDYAPLAEIMGKVPWSPEVFNCNPPDTGNMELLHMFGTPEQQRRWLDPLLAGEIRSVFSMTEPDVASSDATNIATRIERDGDDYVVTGRKWFTSAGGHPNCRVAIVMGVTDDSPETPVHRRQSMILVPFDSPDVRVVRDLPILGHQMHDGLSEIAYEGVRVPKENLLGGEGEGFALAQARLGPGRIHHCMRAIGASELALALMCDRALRRVAFGKPLAEHSSVADMIAESRVEIDQARFLTLHAAWVIDNEGNRAAATAVSAIKLVAARLQQRVSDRAMQVFGGMGITEDTPLSFLFTWGRALRFVDGPDAVHLRTVARAELRRAKANLGATDVYLHQRS